MAAFVPLLRFACPPGFDRVSCTLFRNIPPDNTRYNGIVQILSVIFLMLDIFARVERSVFETDKSVTVLETKERRERERERENGDCARYFEVNS